MRHQREPGDEQVRDGLIQRFEFTYELSQRTLRRYLTETAASPDEIERLPFADLIRAAKAQGPIRGDWPDWRRFCEMRTRTSHTYDETTAAAVVAAIPALPRRGRASARRVATAPGVTAAIRLDLSDNHSRIVLAILREYLPADAAVWVFGSRATGRARLYSDLDLAIDAGRC